MADQKKGNEDRHVRVRIFGRLTNHEHEPLVCFLLKTKLAQDKSLWKGLLAVIVNEDFLSATLDWIETIIQLDFIGVKFEKPSVMSLTTDPHTFLELSFPDPADGPV